MKNKFISVTIALLSAIALSSLTALIYVTMSFTPRHLGPASMTFWFLAVLVFVSSLSTLLDFAIKLRKSDNRAQPRRALQSSLRTGFLLGFTSAILLALSSLRSLSLRDLVLFLLTALIIEIIFRTRKA
jgi:hypothetical protein